MSAIEVEREVVEDIAYDITARRKAEELVQGGTGKLVIYDAKDIQERNAKWVWDKRLPLGTLALAAGKGGSAKSLWCVWACAQITNGTLPGCWEDEPRGVLWVTLEASPEVEVKPRLMAAGADMDRVHFAVIEVGDQKANDHIRVFEDAYLPRLLAVIEKKNIGIIVLDPLLDSIPDRVNSSKQEEIRAALGRIATVAEEADILILGIAHFNKMTTVGDAIDRITGSAAFSQRVRAAIAFAYDEDTGNFVLSQAKNNWGPMELDSLAFKAQEVRVGRHINTISLQWTGESEVSVNDILSRKPTKSESKCEQVVEVIRRTLGNHSLSKADVMAAIEEQVGHVSEGLLQQAKAQAGVVSERSKTVHGAAMWSLKEME